MQLVFSLIFVVDTTIIFGYNFEGDMVKHELRVTSYKLRVESLKARVDGIKARVKIQKCEFKSTGYEFKFTSYEFKSTGSFRKIACLIFFNGDSNVKNRLEILGNMCIIIVC